MQDNFVNYEIALELKEMGFNDKCIASYTQNAYGSKQKKLQYFVEPIEHINEDFVFIAAPLYQQVTKWLRDKHNIDLTTYPVYDTKKCGYDSYKRLGYNYELMIPPKDGGDCFYFDVRTYNRMPTDLHDPEDTDFNVDETLAQYGKTIHPTYEQALESGIKAALIYLKQKNNG